MNSANQTVLAYAGIMGVGASIAGEFQSFYSIGFQCFGSLRIWIKPMPFKHNSARRHRIPKQKFKVTNWAEYEAGLRQRGSVTFWISEAAIAGWIAPLRKTRGGQCRYSELVECSPFRRTSRLV